MENSKKEEQSDQINTNSDSAMQIDSSSGANTTTQSASDAQK